MAAKNLFGSTDKVEWNKILKNYDKVFRLFCDKKKKKDLPELDTWFQSQLGNDMKERTGDPYLKKEELIKLMQWKLSRGKFRPRLTEMVKLNPDDLVEQCSKASFKKLNNPDEAIKELCKLKAVGPATASGILTAFSPGKYAFMADEAVSSVLLGKIDYTLKYYLQYLGKISKKASQLSRSGDKDWTPHDVELALWTYRISQQLDVSLDDDDDAIKKKTAKRKSEDELKASTKKRKT